MGFFRAGQNAEMDGSQHPEGDSACWLHLVCESCGAIVDEHNGHRPGCDLADTTAPTAADCRES
jgi:hypothetical protein